MTIKIKCRSTKNIEKAQGRKGTGKEGKEGRKDLAQMHMTSHFTGHMTLFRRTSKEGGRLPTDRVTTAPGGPAHGGPAHRTAHDDDELNSYGP